MSINSNKIKLHLASIIEMIVLLLAMTVVLLSFVFSGKAVMEDIQLLYYNNRADGTVTKFEYDKVETARSSGGASYYTGNTYYNLDYVITFDEEVAGYSEYEYTADKINTIEKQVGTEYIVLFNNIEQPVLIYKSCVKTDNIILIIFIIEVIIIVCFRKKIWNNYLKIDNSIDDID
jgi:hypothetical protein